MIVTPAALEHIQQHVCDHTPWFRISIQAGGCNGFEKKFQLTDHTDPDDITLSNMIVLDPITFQMLDHAVLDYECLLHHQGLILKIPQATSTCGCGKSFDI